MTISVTHSTPADGTFSTEGAAAWDATHSVTGLGTMAEQNANNVSITGGSISGISGLLTSSDIGVTVQAYSSNLSTWAGKTAPSGTVVGTSDSQTLINKTLTGYTETVYVLGTSGSVALDPANGTIQTCAAAGTVTFTDSLSAGQSIVLMLTGATTYTINFPTVTWISATGNTPPTAAASMSLVFFKISTTLYAAYVGSYA